MQLVILALAYGQSKISLEDSSAIKIQAEGFYTWYIDLSKDHRIATEFNPKFVRRDDGMTTLDFSNYKDALEKYNFSNSFIKRKISDYKNCLDSLDRIPFDKFASYQDLDDFERIGCDFDNRYEWTGGMEPKDEARLSSLRRVDKRTIVGRFSFVPDGEALGTFKKIKGKWQIKNLTLK